MHVGKTIFALTLLLGACGGDKTQPDKSHNNPADIQYILKPDFPEKGQIAVDVTLRFIGEMDGDTQLRLGGRWGNVKNSQKRFRELSVSGHNVVLPSDMSQQNIQIKHEAGTQLTVTYQLSAQDMRNSREDIEYFYVPVLTNDLIHIIGIHGLAIPYRDDRDNKFSVSLNWENLPDGWTAINTLPDEPIYARWIGQQVFAVAPSHNIIRDGRLTILKSGNHSFSAEEFAKRMTGIYNQVNAALRSNAEAYLITLLGAPERPEGGSFTGTGRFNSFAAAATPDFKLDDLTPVLTHEVLHHWIPGSLGSWPQCADDDQDCRNYIRWFSEGFTDFVAAQMMIEGGYWDREDLVNFTNDYLQDYHLSAAQNAQGKIVEELFWEDFEHERQPYWRGFLIAMNWDAETKYFTKGGRSLLSDFKDMHEKANGAGEDFPVLTPDYIAGQFSHRRDRVEDIERYYLNGETIDMRPGLFPDCAILTTKPVYRYDVGFDPEATLSTGIVTGVQPGHNAVKAGLKNGQSLVAKVSGGGGNTAAPLVLEIKEKDQSKTISYMPLSRDSVLVPQFEITGPCSNEHFYWE